MQPSARAREGFMQAAARARRIRYLGLAFGGLVTAVLAVATIVWVNIDLIEHAGSDVAEAQGEMAWADATLDAASDQQNALDGVVATHDRRYVAPFRQGQQRFEHALERLAAFASTTLPTNAATWLTPAGSRESGHAPSPSRR